ncbi:MAG: 4-hydroxy-tetrahydrodipicolinate synthase [Nitrososphaerota archaeon]|nr:4-hydroxy-tetrahydrodipicolinate synthase [Nitrososphaerota archaeon]
MALAGCYTALVTPFTDDLELDGDALSRLLSFQSENGVGGVVMAGTTGESPTLTHEEWRQMLAEAVARMPSRSLVVAGTGGNDTKKSVQLTREAVDAGAGAALVVDPYYNGPSSVEIRREHYAPIAEAAGEVTVIPYIIPGRTGTQLAPEDLALLARSHPNVRAVKEATGDAANASAIRALCGKDFSIFSGDDDKTLSFMTAPSISACGVISVVSNVAPRAVTDMVSASLAGDRATAEALAAALKPLFELVTVKTEERVMDRNVAVKARNPLPIKTLSSLLGMQVGRCRPPLGRMTRSGLNRVLENARKVWRDTPEIFEPIERHFDVSISDRLGSPKFVEGLCYDDY